MTSRGQSLIYNGGLSLSYGGSRLSGLNQYAKDTKVISKIGNVSNVLGTTGRLDDLSRGSFTKITNLGKKKGYGRKKKGKGKK